ncbi:hypothetical protein [Microvirga lotononidis]|uniref:Uncharacterized protein n=1 Tax=Microvirga lotononidis TaxID=864069 RepID=I4Z423_9HYPH|nr:hypothetical protein [Microvirga lotononidis]EIM30965.1 hypothetical protein MicloDRAFT_00004960 [Microvirga lotononidis]WQO30272.1 hypothetical protein U0023_28705 [Microvirga lotononidis]
MKSQPDLASQALSGPDLIEEVQFQDYRIQFGPTQTGWVSFIARQGQRPTILLAGDRETLIAEAHTLIRRRIAGKG